MKKILVTAALICFVAFISNAQTAPSATKETKKTEATATAAAPDAKKAGCCHKGTSMADCKNKSAKNCTTTKAEADAKTKKATAVAPNNN